MNIINPENYGIKPGEDISRAMTEMLYDAAHIKGEKLIKFTEGTYYLSAENCREYELIITNTVTKDSFSADERPHINAVPFYFGNIKNLTFDGSGSVFIIDGRVTNIAVENCSGVEIKNIELKTLNPDMHSLSVINKTEKYIDFSADEGSNIKIIKGIPCFYGRDYIRSFTDDPDAGYIGLIHKKTPDKIERTLHPLNGYRKIECIDEKIFRVYYDSTSRFYEGDSFYIYDVRRQFAGIFINRSENIKISGIKQRFNYSLAYVAQMSRDLSIENCTFAPCENSPLKAASCADFIQCCMCRGLFSVSNSYFEGAMDDCMNVHGIHFKIVKKDGNKITVRFMHPETYGFNPLMPGDKIEFISPDTLLSSADAEIISSCLLTDTDIELEISDSSAVVLGDAVEDVSACPCVYFGNNIINRIITRGILLTTGEKSVIENNNFISTTMSGILLSDDAKSWYESGKCLDVTIRNNKFIYCGETPVLIKPENSVHSGAVHKNINIISNIFNYEGKSISIKSAENVNIKDNKFLCGDYLHTENCKNIIKQ